MCYCPQSLPPPTQELERCRLILQILALSSFLVALFSILAGQFFFLFNAMMLSYLLFIAWARFEYQLALYFFFIAFIFTLMTYVTLIGMIQYYDRISRVDAAQLLFLIAKIAYFPNATFFSHYAYKQFKHYALFNLSLPNSIEMKSASTFNSNSQSFFRPGNAAFQGSAGNQGGAPRGFVAFKGQATSLSE